MVLAPAYTNTLDRVPPVRYKLQQLNTSWGYPFILPSFSLKRVCECLAFLRGSVSTCIGKASTPVPSEDCESRRDSVSGRTLPEWGRLHVFGAKFGAKLLWRQTVSGRESLSTPATGRGRQAIYTTGRTRRRVLRWKGTHTRAHGRSPDRCRMDAGY